MIKINGKELEFITYPNGEFGLKNFDEKDLDLEKNIIQWNTDINWEKECLTLLLIGAMFSYKFIELKIDYLPLSREDKTENGRLDLFHQMLENLGEYFLLTFETLHNAEDYSLETINDEKFLELILDGLEIIESTEWEDDEDRDPVLLVVFPDESAHKRYFNDVEKLMNNYSLRTEVFYLTAHKSRNKENGKINDEPAFSPSDIETLLGINPDYVFMVDDLISFGGSFLRVSKEIDKALGCHPETTLYVYGNELQELSDEFNKHINEVMWVKDIDFKRGN